MHTSILVALDHSPLAEQALEPAASLARRWSVPLGLVTVALAGSDPGDDRYLERVAARFDDLDVERHVVAGMAADPALVQLAAARPDALLCLASHGRSGLGQLLLGSVSEAVVRELGRPVLVVGPAGGRPVPDGRIVVPLDGSDAAETIVPEAARWAVAFGSRLVLAHVGGSHAVDGPAVDLAAVASRWADTGATIEIREITADEPADALIEEASSTETALVAMTTHGRSGLRRLALGSVAARIVHRAPTPVLLLRPSG